MDRSAAARKYLISWSVALFLLILLVIVLWRSHMGSIRFEDVIGNMIKKSEVISQMRTELLRSVEAEKASVMADTDEESKHFADLANRADTFIDEHRSRLRELIQSAEIPEEMQLLQGFDSCWAEYRKIHKAVLDYAVQNTNLKASNLSFTKSREALARFEQSLADLIELNPGSVEGSKISRASFIALSSACEIYAMQAPHIFEATAPKMDRMESSMTTAAERVHTALKVVEQSMDAGREDRRDEALLQRGKILLSQARGTFTIFMQINHEILRLSRENTNIKSVELSLGAKRKVTAQCLDSLNALQQAVRSRDFKATR